MKLKYHDRTNRVWSMTKTKQDNDVTDHIGAVYTEIGTELSWLIEQDVTYHKN